MISMYKWKKNAVMVTLGVIPTIIFVMIFFITLKYYTLEGIRFTYIDPLWFIISMIIAIVTAVILMFVGNRLLRHAFTTMLEGKGLVTLILDSTGVIGSFNVQVNAPKMQGVDPAGNPIIEDIYDVDLLHRLMVPKDVTMGEAVTFEKDEESGNIKFGEKVNVIVLPEGDKKYDNTFMFENRPVFIFNKVMGKFLSRDSLAKFEKDMEIKHNALNILRKVQETDTSFRNFGRYIGENIKPVKKGLFASPIIKWILIGVVVFLVIMIIMMFVPGMLQAGSNIL